MADLLKMVLAFCCACFIAGCSPRGGPSTPTPAPAAAPAAAPISNPTGEGAGAGSPTAKGGESQMTDLQHCLLGHWIHSHEEDTPGVMVYRRAGYAFPPSRGRDGYEFKESGGLVYYGIAPTDGSASSPGSWAMEGLNQVRIMVDSPRIQPFVMHIQSCDGEMLKISS